jgi:hypothetical protein
MQSGLSPEIPCFGVKWRVLISDGERFDYAKLCRHHSFKKTDRRPNPA